MKRLGAAIGSALVLAGCQMSDENFESFNGMSRAKMAVAQDAYTNMPSGAVLILMGFSVGIANECDDLEIDQAFHGFMRGKMNRAVVRNREKVQAEAKEASDAFRIKHGLNENSPSSARCAAARKEIAEGSFLGASWNQV